MSVEGPYKVPLVNEGLEPLPGGANFIRAKTLWEIGLDVAGDPSIIYGGNRDLRISVGSGGGAQWKPSLNFGTGSAILAHDVCNGSMDAAFVNPSALLTQAYLGKGLFTEALPVRVIMSHPSWDSFAMMVHPRTKLRSVADIARQKYPLKMSVREDPTHSTFSLIEQIFNLEGFGLKDVLSWGGEIVGTGAPAGPKRMQPIQEGEVDAIFDEALVTWLSHALKCGYEFLEFAEGQREALTELGWRKSTINAGDYPGLDRSYECIDFSGWPLYCDASLPDDVVIDICEAVVARQNQIPWAAGDYQGIEKVFQNTLHTPVDVPFHTGVTKFLAKWQG